MSIKSLLCPSDSPETSTAALAAQYREPAGSDHDHDHDHAPAHAHAEPDHDTMTCDQAWKTLKAHPNSRFASLALLADVVAGRTVCTGPRGDEPGASLPGSPAAAPSAAQQALSQEVGVGAPRLRSKPISTESKASGSSPVPGPLAAPVARKRNMAVETSAVRDALRLLDKTPGPSPSLRAASIPQSRAEAEQADVVRDAKRRKVEP
jgi:hypothetical protein